MLGKPAQGSMIALKRVTRYLKGTKHFFNKLELDGDIDKVVARLDGFSDSDWAGSTDQKSQCSGVLFVDEAPLYSFSRRRSVIATSSGMAEFYAGYATAVEMLLARDVLMFFGCQVEASLHMCEGGVDVVDVVTPLVRGCAQVVLHGDQVVELSVLLDVHEEGEVEEDGEGQVEVERKKVKSKRNAQGLLCGWDETQEHPEP